MKKTEQQLEQLFADLPVVAIIRGVQPEEAVEIGSAIADAGIKIIEVPLNSPESFKSIENLAKHFGDECVVGCGTLVNKKDAKRVADAGGQIAVTPNSNPAIIKRCRKLGLVPMPGWATPSEAFAAYQAGARYLKLFPASTYGLGHVKAVTAVLPNDAKILAVGGVGASDAEEWLNGGVDGFGIGSEIYKAGRSAEEVAERAAAVVKAIRAIQ